MSVMTVQPGSLPLPFGEMETSIEPDVEARITARDRAGRQRAVDPAFNVALRTALPVIDAGQQAYINAAPLTIPTRLSLLEFS